jgi:virginiamycin B lyase
MNDRPTFDPFERRLAAEFERFVQPAIDPKPIHEIAEAAMRPRDLVVRARNLSRPRRLLLLGIAAALLVPATYIGASLLRPPTPLPVLALSRIQVGEPAAPRWFAADGQSLWVHEPTSLVRVDLATSAVTGTAPLNAMQYGYVATGAGAVWQTDWANDVLVKIDPVTGKTLASIPVGSAPSGVAVTEGSVWVADQHSGTVSRIDPATNKVIATIALGPVEDSGPQIMAAGPGGVWVGLQNTGENVRIDAATNTVGLRVPLDGPVASDGTQVWIGADEGNGRAAVVRVDPATGKAITTVELETGDPCGMAVGLGSVWVADGGLTRIDEATGRIVGRLDLGGDCGNVTVAGGAVWVTADGQPYVLRISPT